MDRPIFIVGMGRSGTTLLGRILACHPDVGFLNEPKAMWHVIRPDEDIIGSYTPERVGRLFLDESDAEEDAQRRAGSLFSWYLFATRSQRLVDKYPELVFRPRFVRGIFPDAKFLIAVRSPWSTLRSVDRWSQTHARDGATWWGLDGRRKWEILWREGVVEHKKNTDIAALDLFSTTDERTRAAVEWLVTMREALRLADDPLTLVVRYEALAGSPRKEVQRILHFCQLSESQRTEIYADEIVQATNVEQAARREPGLEPVLGDLIEETWERLQNATPQVPYL